MDTGTAKDYIEDLQLEIERLRTELTEWKMVATDYRSHHLGDAYGECDCDPCERYQTTKRNYATVVVVKVNLTKEKMREIWHQSVDKVFRDE